MPARHPLRPARRRAAPLPGRPASRDHGGETTAGPPESRAGRRAGPEAAGLDEFDLPTAEEGRRQVEIIEPGRLWGLCPRLGRQRIGDRRQHEAGDDLDNEVPDHDGIT